MKNKGPALSEARRRRRRVEGFTLIELMLAIFIVAIIMTIIYSTIVSTMQADERIEELTQGSEIGPALLAQITQDLGAAFIPDDKFDYFVGQDRKGGGGDKDRVDFLSSVMVFDSESQQVEPRFHSVNEIGYQLKDSPDTPGQLMLYRKVDAFIDSEPLRGGKLTLMAEHVMSFNIEYWTGTQWIGTWISSKSENKLPPAIKVELKLLIPDKTAEGGHTERTYSTIIPMIR